MQRNQCVAVIILFEKLYELANLLEEDDDVSIEKIEMHHAGAFEVLFAGSEIIEMHYVDDVLIEKIEFEMPHAGVFNFCLPEQGYANGCEEAARCLDFDFDFDTDSE
ncbi:hypothetical protein E2542_SST09436 [Spatholobus suberectus]|nr:hypothetical protein E2542_SST09436 [Spatholobus suberectus]